MSKAGIGSFTDLLDLDVSIVLWLATEENKFRQKQIDELEKLLWRLR